MNEIECDQIGSDEYEEFGETKSKVNRIRKQLHNNYNNAKENNPECHQNS